MATATPRKTTAKVATKSTRKPTTKKAAAPKTAEVDAQAAVDEKFTKPAVEAVERVRPTRYDLEDGRRVTTNDINGYVIDRFGVGSTVVAGKDYKEVTPAFVVLDPTGKVALRISNSEVI